jgi:hypothetical protein
MSLIVPFEKKFRRESEVTRTGSPPAARIWPTIVVKFFPMDSGGALNQAVKRVKRSIALSLERGLQSFDRYAQIVP